MHCYRHKIAPKKTEKLQFFHNAINFEIHGIPLNPSKYVKLNKPKRQTTKNVINYLLSVNDRQNKMN